jgi:hypothetical protein
VSGYPAQSFESRVDRSAGPDGCHLWMGGMHTTGYGGLSVGGKSLRAHRRAYELAYGPVAEGVMVCHRCDNRRCVNVAHLFLGSHADNMADLSSKQRRHGERNSRAKLSTEQVLEIRRLWRSGVQQKDLAKTYGVGKTQMSVIVRGLQWSHV